MLCHTYGSHFATAHSGGRNKLWVNYSLSMTLSHKMNVLDLSFPEFFLLGVRVDSVEVRVRLVAVTISIIVTLDMLILRTVLFSI